MSLLLKKIFCLYLCLSQKFTYCTNEEIEVQRLNAADMAQEVALAQPFPETKQWFHRQVITARPFLAMMVCPPRSRFPIIDESDSFCQHDAPSLVALLRGFSDPDVCFCLPTGWRVRLLHGFSMQQLLQHPCDKFAFYL